MAKCGGFITYVCALIGISDLKIRDMSSDMISGDRLAPTLELVAKKFDLLVTAGITSKNIKQYPRVHQCLSTIVPLHHANHFWCPHPFIL